VKKNKSEILDSGFHFYSFFSLSFFLDSALEVLHSTATAAAALQVSDYGKSGNPKRQKENLAIYSVTLTGDGSVYAECWSAQSIFLCCAQKLRRHCPIVPARAANTLWVQGVQGVAEARHGVFPRSSLSFTPLFMPLFINFHIRRYITVDASLPSESAPSWSIEYRS
jgi:hypothetical protein